MRNLELRPVGTWDLHEWASVVFIGFVVFYVAYNLTTLITRLI